MNNTSARLMPASMLIAACLCLLMLFHPVDAFATWPFQEARPYGLLFGEKYSTPSGSQNNHGGLDILAAAGSVVVSPVSGRVSFVGRVPAGEGATQLAVSLQLDDGRIVSLMPFEVTSVGKGQYLTAGVPLGTLAATGDRSSDSPHLHVGLRSGSLYLDPSMILVAPSPNEKPSDSPIPATVPSQLPATGGAPATAGAAASSPAVQSLSAPSAARAEGDAATFCAEVQASQITVATTPNLLRIPEIETQCQPAASVPSSEHVGDRKFLDGIRSALQALPARKAVGVGVLSVMTGLIGVGCLANSARRSAATKQSELPLGHPAEEQVAAASGQW